MSLEVAFAFALMGIIGLVVMLLMTKLYGFVTWQSGIPFFYLLYFFIFPLLEQILGAFDYASRPNLLTAAALASLGLLAFAAGTVIADSWIGARAEPAWSQRWPAFTAVETPLGAAFMLLVGGCATLVAFVGGYAYVDEAGSAGGIVSTLTIALLVANAVSLQKSIESGWRADVWTVMALLSMVIQVVAGIAASSKAMVIYPIALLAVIHYAHHGRAPWRLIVAIGLLYMAVIYPVVTMVRFARALDMDYGEILEIARLALSGDLGAAGDVVGADLDTSGAVAGLSRGLLRYFIAVIDACGTQLPFLLGETYSNAVLALIPRFLAPDKAFLGDFNIFLAHQLGFLHPTDFVTNVSPSQFAEMYLNFGAAGVVVGMFIWGVASAGTRTFLVGQSHWLAGIIFLNIIWQEAFVEATLTPLVKTAFVYFALASIAHLLNLSLPQLAPQTTRHSTST